VPGRAAIRPDVDGPEPAVFLPKPFDLDALLAAVGAALDGA
jgi:hypothetical protein